MRSEILRNIKEYAKPTFQALVLSAMLCACTPTQHDTTIIGGESKSLPIPTLVLEANSPSILSATPSPNPAEGESDELRESITDDERISIEEIEYAVKEKQAQLVQPLHKISVHVTKTPPGLEIDFSQIVEARELQFTGDIFEKIEEAVKILSVQTYEDIHGSSSSEALSLNEYIQEIDTERYEILNRLNDNTTKDLLASEEKKQLEDRLNLLDNMWMKAQDELSKITGNPRYSQVDSCNIYVADFLRLLGVGVSHRIDPVTQEPVLVGGQELSAAQMQKWLLEHGETRGITNINSFSEEQRYKLLENGNIIIGTSPTHMWLIIPGKIQVKGEEKIVPILTQATFNFAYLYAGEGSVRYNRFNPDIEKETDVDLFVVKIDTSKPDELSTLDPNKITDYIREQAWLRTQFYLDNQASLRRKAYIEQQNATYGAQV